MGAFRSAIRSCEGAKPRRGVLDSPRSIVVCRGMPPIRNERGSWRCVYSILG